MEETSNNFKRSYLFLFLIWPLFAVITASLSNNRKVFVFIWTLFFTYFGYTFLVSPVSDGNHYRVTFLEIHDWIKFQGLTFGDLLAKIYDYYPDPYVPIASYFVGFFTGDWHAIFSLYGLVLGYFFSSNIFSMIEMRAKILENKNRLMLTLGLIFVIFLVPIWEINGVRMWTACHFFVYHFFKYTQTGKTKHLILFNLAGFFHASFMSVPLITLTYFFFNRMNFKFRILLVMAVVLSKQFGVMINPAFEKIEGNGALAQKFNTYNDEKYLKGFTEKGKENVEQVDDTSWFMKFNHQYMGLLSMSMVLISLFMLWQLSESENIEKPEFKRLIGAFLALTFISYFISLHPSPSASRFIRVTGVFSGLALAQIIYQWESFTQKVTQQVILVPLVYLVLFVLVVQTRLGFENFNSALFFGNPIYVAYQEDPKPLIELYHSIFGVYGGGK